MSTRLTREDWIRHGTDTLADTGFVALKVDPLAKRLGVSRGSFYWHFRDLADYQQAVLAHWHSRSTEQVITRIEATTDQRLTRLMREAFDAPWDLERAVRAWAAQESWVAQEVAQVDQARLHYVEGLLREEGLPRSAAKARALLLYWAVLGQMMTSSDLRLSRSAVAGLSHTLLRP
ncbi:MAG: TetR/AcrR family transcriptional regulator [Pseudomonadota bacterium]